MNVNDDIVSAAFRLLSALESKPGAPGTVASWLAKEAERQLEIEQSAEALRAAFVAWEDEYSARINDENTADLLERIAAYNRKSKE